MVGVVEGRGKRCLPNLSKFAIFFGQCLHLQVTNGDNVVVKRPSTSAGIATTWELARSGNLRGATDAARKALGELGQDAASSSRVELHLVAAFCAMRQGQHSDAMRELDAAEHSARSPKADRGL